MATVYYPTDSEKRCMDAKIAAGQPLTTRERAYLAQAEADAKQEGKRIAAITKKDQVAAIEATTPEHLRRPRNIPAETVAALEAGYQFKTPEQEQRLAKHREAAAIREKEIEKEMEGKRLAYERENDPEVKRALSHWDYASQNASPEDKQAWNEAKGLLLGGGKAVLDQYWQRATELTGLAKQRDGDKITAEGDALRDQFQRYCQANAAFEKSCSQAETTLEEIKRALQPPTV